MSLMPLNRVGALAQMNALEMISRRLTRLQCGEKRRRIVCWNGGLHICVISLAMVTLCRRCCLATCVSESNCMVIMRCNEDHQICNLGCQQISWVKVFSSKMAPQPAASPTNLLLPSRPSCAAELRRKNCETCQCFIVLSRAVGSWHLHNAGDDGNDQQEQFLEPDCMTWQYEWIQRRSLRSLESLPLRSQSEDPHTLATPWPPVLPPKCQEGPPFFRIRKERKKRSEACTGITLTDWKWKQFEDIWSIYDPYLTILKPALLEISGDQNLARLSHW